jgi:RimJ/RimL family protein N-acetyltransferase
MLILSNAGQSESNEVHIGYLILQSRQGEGFATELVRGFVDWAGSQSEIE